MLKMLHLKLKARFSVRFRLNVLTSAFSGVPRYKATHSGAFFQKQAAYLYV